MKARFKYRFYPTDQQQQSLAQLFGCVRVVWNDALALSKANGKYPGYNLLSKALTVAKRSDNRCWLADVSSVPLQQSLKDLDQAFSNYFKSRKGQRKGKKVGEPNFKKKTSTQTARFSVSGFKLKGQKVYLAKIGDIQPIWSRELPYDPSSVTVIKDAAGRYFVSFVVDIQPESLPAKNQSIGIDLGLKTFAVCSNGESFHSPDYKPLNRCIARLQRKMSRQVKGSNRRAKTRLQLAKLHAQIVDLRSDFLHKLSTKVVKENAVIILEDLNVSGMVKNRKLSRAISLQGWRQFRELCKAKSEKWGRDFRVISRWEPTSQTCSECGFRWGKLDLSVRRVVCLSCGTEHDRDENAAKSIENAGMGHRHGSKRTVRDCKTASVADLSDPLRISVL